MNEAPPRRHGRSECPAAPGRDLFIYYLSGHLSPGHKIIDDSFIGNWEEDSFSFLFFSRPALEKVSRLIQGQPHLHLIDHYHMTYEQWHGGPLKPLRIGRFLIAAPWQSREQVGQDFNIILDPGVVFGTGTHPTTRDCFEALERACSDGGVKTVLDLGTGTGLLALAAIGLGCSRVLGVDFNYLAAETALANVRQNGLQEKILIVQGRAEEFMACPVDLVMANIHFDVMCSLIDSPGFLKQHRFILSGLLRSQAREIAHRLAGLPVKIIEKWERDAVWHTFYGQVAADLSSV